MNQPPYVLVTPADPRERAALDMKAATNRRKPITAKRKPLSAPPARVPLAGILARALKKDANHDQR